VPSLRPLVCGVALTSEDSISMHCEACIHDPARTGKIHRGASALFHVPERPELEPVCLGHALVCTCDNDCGHLIAYCHLWGCGQWKPIAPEVTQLMYALVAAEEAADIQAYRKGL
jgi:hypothetical protein